MRDYNESAAVRYALAYGADPNLKYRYFEVYDEDGGDCANFVSQCLHVGGIRMVYGGEIPWWYQQNGNKGAQSWSLAWTVAHSLFWCLKVRQEKKSPGPKGVEVASIDELGRGDLIFYIDVNGSIDHVAMITDFNGSTPLITQHSPDEVNISPYKEHKASMRFIKVM